MPNISLETKCTSPGAMILAKKIENELKAGKNYSPVMTKEGNVYVVCPSFGTDYMVLLDVSVENKRQKWSCISYKDCAILRANYIYKHDFDSEKRADIDIEAENVTAPAAKTKTPKKTVEVETISETKVVEEEFEVDVQNEIEPVGDINGARGIGADEVPWATEEEITNGPGNETETVIEPVIEDSKPVTPVSKPKPKLRILENGPTQAILATFTEHADPTSKHIYFKDETYAIENLDKNVKFEFVSKIDKIVSNQLILKPDVGDTEHYVSMVLENIPELVKSSPKGHRTILCIFDVSVNESKIQEALLENPTKINLKDFKSAVNTSLFGKQIKIILIKLS